MLLLEYSHNGIRWSVVKRSKIKVQKYVHLTCIFVVRRCVDIRLYLKEKLDLAGFEKIVLKLKKDPIIISALFTTLERVFFSFFLHSCAWEN